ncbi:MAG: adenylate kinase [Chitinophagales bacterium]|nr:adenylate kinase [Chitinophagales bacterium]
MLNIILFGPPGSGKGTQAQNLIEKYLLLHISTGDLLRQEIKEETVLGLEAKKLMDAGKLVPDDVVIGMIASRLDANPDAKGFIFDGFPRTLAQAEALDTLLEMRSAPIKILLSLQVRDEELKVRLMKRGETSDRPDDKDPAVIERRIQVYKEQTFPVAEYYAKQGKLAKIFGEGSIEATFDLLVNELEKIKQPLGQ